MAKLTEAGMVRHDLDHLVLPLVEIDTFESKIDDARAIVIAFYVFEQEPAKDLERFIEKSEIKVMDSETSPAPTEDGYYVVFVELNRDDNFPEFVIRIVEDVDNLTNIKKWQFKTVGSTDIHDLTLDNLREFVNLDPESVPPSDDDVQDELDDEREKEELETEPEAEEEASKEEPEEEEVAEAIAPILKNGLMESVELDSTIIHLSSPGVRLAYDVVYAGTEQPSVPVLAYQIGHPLINESAKLSRLLGTYYMVETVEDGLLVSCDDGYMILQPLD